SFKLTSFYRLDIRENVALTETLFLGEYDSIFVNEKGFFISRIRYNYDSMEGSDVWTKLTQWMIPKSGAPSPIAEGALNGSVTNGFAMDHYKGILRVALTARENGKSVGRVFTLKTSGRKLSEVGRSPDLAPGEEVKSVRFVGDIGYVVTFKKVDPLFVLDLSNPKTPKVAGSLKIPGYSTYIHPIEGKKLLT
ncbi:MAG: beta-propeller domain-containing protein, partial [Proteobacteria bacterium]|nr:beta-propeller domain-containing protein [Pseudomonadota bacterium]